MYTGLIGLFVTLVIKEIQNPDLDAIENIPKNEYGIRQYFGFLSEMVFFFGFIHATDLPLLIFMLCIILGVIMQEYLMWGKIDSKTVMYASIFRSKLFTIALAGAITYIVYRVTDFNLILLFKEYY